MKKNHSLLSKHAKSFNWAGFFLSKKVYQKSSTLYSFCRTLDDICDQDKSLSFKKKNSNNLNILLKQETNPNP